MITNSEMAAIIEKSGYKKKYVAEQMNMQPEWLSAVLAGRRKLQVSEYIAFCNLFKIAPDGRPME